MAKHSETDFIIPTLKVIYYSKDGCTTKFIKSEISKYIDLTEDDKKSYPSRAKNEPSYYQIVGNLISHRNINLFKYIESVNSNVQTNNIIWKLNKSGKEYVEKTLLKDEIITDIDNGIYDSFDEKIIEKAKKNNLKKRPDTDPKLSKMVAEANSYQCQYARLIHENHDTFYDKKGNKYVEVHHLIPMKARIDFFPKSLDRPSNLVCLCPNCHSKLHKGSIEEKNEMLKILYDFYKTGLKNDDIYIKFEDLLYKYYG